MFNRVWNRHFAFFLPVSFLNLDTPRKVTKSKRKQKKWADCLNITMPLAQENIAYVYKRCIFSYNVRNLHSFVGFTFWLVMLGYSEEVCKRLKVDVYPNQGSNSQYFSHFHLLSLCLARPWSTLISSFQAAHIFKREEFFTVSFRNMQHKLIAFLILLQTTNVCLFIICCVKRYAQGFSYSPTEISTASVN